MKVDIDARNLVIPVRYNFLPGRFSGFFSLLNCDLCLPIKMNRRNPPPMPL
jgi:hypothetical protein